MSVLSQSPTAVTTKLKESDRSIDTAEAKTSIRDQDATPKALTWCNLRPLIWQKGIFSQINSLAKDLTTETRVGGMPTMPSVRINSEQALRTLESPDPTLHSSPSPLLPLPNSVTRCLPYPDSLSKAITKDKTAVSGQTTPGSRACTQPLNLHLTSIPQTSYVTCKYPLLLFADTPSPLCLSFAVWS